MHPGERQIQSIDMSISISYFYEMTLEQLRIFLQVAQQLSMTRAAERLHLSQPAVSAAIAALEERYDTRLFERVGRRLELSEAGRQFLPEAQAVLARAESARQVLDDLAGLMRGALRFAASQTLATYWLPARMARFAAAYPAIRLSLSVGNSAQTAQALLDGDADIGFIEGSIDQPGLRRQPIGRDRLGLYAAPGHPLARPLTRTAAGRPLAREDLLATAWVLREPGSGTRETLERGLAARGIALADLDVRLELPSNGAVLEALAGGDLVASVSELAAEQGLAAGRIVRLDCPLGERDFHLLVHRERRPSRAAAAFLKALQARP